MTPRAIPLADGVAFSQEARRFRAARFVIAASLIAVLGASVVAAKTERHGARSPAGPRDGIVVLDVSFSIKPDNYPQTAATLRQLAESGRRYGLILVSDVAYEAFPPGTPATQLRAVARLFSPLGPNDRPPPWAPRSDEHPRFLVNPWEQTIGGGTVLSAGLNLARQILERDRIRRPSVILVSDLNDSYQDLAGLARAVIGLQRAGIGLHAIGLSPGLADLKFYRSLTGNRRAVVAARQRNGSGPAFPIWLFVLGGVLIALAALNEYWCSRLSWQPREVAA
jgi:hypothetical protein